MSGRKKHWLPQPGRSNGFLGRLNKSEVILARDLFIALRRLNPDLPATACQQAVDQISRSIANKHLAAIKLMAKNHLYLGVNKVVNLARHLRGSANNLCAIKIAQFYLLLLDCRGPIDIGINLAQYMDITDNLISNTCYQETVLLR